MRVIPIGFAPAVLVSLAAWVALGPAYRAGAQVPAGDHTHIFLPPAYGATPLSTIIDAEAHWIAAYGDFLESAAFARKVNAEAFALEIENAIRYVEAYFERRRLNKEARAPDRNYLLREKKRKEVIETRIKTQFQDVLEEADLSDKLNWLLTELSGPATAYRYLSEVDRKTIAEFDQPLPPGYQDLVWVTDGGRKGRALVFPLGKGEVLQLDWPPGLRDIDSEAMRDARGRFEAAKQRALSEVRGKEGKLSDATARELVESLNGLLVALEAAYPRETRSDPQTFLTYNDAKYYLKSLVAQVNRLLTTNDPLVFDPQGALVFRGKTVLDLLQHMYQTGLRFAPPRPGGERVYENLMQNLRNLYINLGEVGDAELQRAGRPAQKQ